jgi:hypothetical protein
MRMKIKRIAGALGAELYGANLKEPLSLDMQKQIQLALLYNLVIFLEIKI